MLTLDRPFSSPTAGQARPSPAETVLPGEVQGLAATLMDQIECGLLACDGQGRLLHANRAARRELDAGQVLKLVDGSVRGATGVASELMLALYDAAHRQRSRLLWVGEGEQRLMVIAMPVRGGCERTPTALLMLGRRSLCSPLGLEMLAIQHGLTLAERRVLRALIGNQSAREIASDHGVAMSTVRTQIQSIRGKVGVRNIDALLLRAAQVPPVSAWHDCGGRA